MSSKKIPINDNPEEQPDQEPEAVEQEFPEDPAADVDQADTEEAAPMDLQQERDDLMGRLQRLSADYQNYRKRVQKDISQSREFANESLIKELLGVLDDMERALAAAKENHGEEDPFFQGMQLVHDKMLTVLGQFGLTPLVAIGEPFDPQRHSAVLQEPRNDVEPMTVLQEVQRGYELKGRTIRPSSVVVSKAPEEDSA